MYEKFKSLHAQIVELLEVEPHTPEYDQVYVYCLEHICLKTSIKEFHNNLKQVVDFKSIDSDITPSQFRLAISKSGYILLKLRFYTIYLSLQRNKLEDHVYEYYMYQFDIDATDSAVVTDLLEQKLLGRRTLKRVIRSTIKAKDKKLYSPECVKETIQEFNLMLPDLRTFINRVIYKKLRFIMKTYNMTRDEFVSELMFSAIKAHYKSKPNNRSFEHNLNTVRSSINNATINIINDYTTNKRERLVNEGQDAQGHNVFNLRVVSENQMRLTDMSGDDLDISYDSMFSSSLRLKQERVKDIDFSVEQLLRKYGYRSKRGKLLNVYFKQNCWMFSRWLTENKYLRSETKTTQEFMDSKTQDEFLTILAEYLDTTVKCLREKALPNMAKALAII